MTIDCSLAAQDERRQMLKELQAKLNSGVDSVSDRSRSVTYRSDAEIRALIRDLSQTIDFCDGKPWRSRRFVQLPYNKYV